MNTYMDTAEHTMQHKQNYVVTTPVPRDIWQKTYLADSTAIFHQSPRWMEYLCAAGGYENISRLYEFKNGKHLVLPLVKRRGIPDVCAFAESLPYAWGHGGPLASSVLEKQDIAVVMKDLAQVGYLSTSIRPNPLQGALWAAAQLPKMETVARCSHVLDLSGGFEEVWTKRFSKQKRKDVRRAQHAGLEVECDTTGRLIPVYYKLYEQSLVRWAQQQHEPLWMARLRAHLRDSQSKLKAMADFLGEYCRVWVAWHEGRPVASHIVLQDTNSTPILGAVDKPAAAATNANSLLERLTIEDACQAGCRYYDMGETGENKGLAYYKRGYGAVAVTYADYHLERLPFTKWDRNLRGFVKGLIGFKDV